jgi:hypothetical protein
VAEPDRVIVTRTNRNWLREDGILQSATLPGASQSLADAHENTAAYARLTGGKRLPLLMDLRSVSGPLHREAREFYSGAEYARVVSATALLVGSPVGRLIGTFVLRLNRPVSPIRIFTSEPEAVAWLEGYRP